MDNSLLSRSNIPVRDRLIVALDLPSIEEAKSLVLELDESVSFYKIGLELFMSGEYFGFMDFLKEKDKHIFADLKLFDIPETVRRAVKVLGEKDIDFVSVHGNDSILEAAVGGASGSGLNVLAVTVLTSLDESDIAALGFNSTVEELVLSRARKALSLGCGGIISSGIEVKRLREEGELSSLIFVCPGIRPVENRAIDDQKRVVGVKEAFLNGADYIVVGRPIRDADNPRQMALKIQRDIENLF